MRPGGLAAAVAALVAAVAGAVEESVNAHSHSRINTDQIERILKVVVP